MESEKLTGSRDVDVSATVEVSSFSLASDSLMSKSSSEDESSSNT